MIQDNIILAIETSSRIGSVALGTNKQLLSQNTFSAPLCHSAEILPCVQSLLYHSNRQPSDIHYVYLSIGPGSFTGLRIAVAMAKTINLANNAKIVAVDTLDTIVMNLPIDTFNERETVATILDAKRNHFYIAVYQCNMMPKNNTSLLGYPERHKVWNKILDDTIMTPEQILDSLRSFHHPVHLLGDGLLYYQGLFQTEWTSIVDVNLWSPRASQVYTLGIRKALREQFDDPLTLTPRYLGPPQVTIKKNRP